MRQRKRKGKAGASRASRYRDLADGRLGKELAALLGQGKFQQSLEVTKEIRRRNLIEPNRTLVEKAYRLRAIELVDLKRFSESSTTVENAIASDAATPPLADVALCCAIATGKPATFHRTLRVTAPGKDVEAALLADLAILVPPRNKIPPGAQPPSHLAGSLASDVRRILGAFEHYEEGRVPEMRSELAGIGRRSPVARWRYLLRGLLARMESNDQDARRAWKAVSPVGACGVLAAHLLDTLPADPAGGPDSVPTKKTAGAAPRLPDAHLHDLRVVHLRHIRDLARKLGSRPDANPTIEDDLVAAVRRAVRSWPGGLSGPQRERLFHAVLAEADVSRGLYQKLTRLLSPLAEDTTGLRQAAIGAEASDPEIAHELWHEYLESAFRRFDLAETRPHLADALIWERVGDLARKCHRQETTFGRQCPTGQKRSRRFADVVSPSAGTAYRQSIRLDPDAPNVRRKLADLLLDMGKQKEAEATWEALFKRFPGDVMSRLRLAELCFERQAYRKAMHYLEKARDLEPLNRGVTEKMAECLVFSGWRRARKGRLDLARKDFLDAGDILEGAPRSDHHLLHAAVEHADGNADTARRLFEDALSAGLWEPEAHLRYSASLRELTMIRDAQSHEKTFARLISKLQANAATIERVASIFPALNTAEGNGACLGSARSKLKKLLHRGRDRAFARETRIALCHLFDAEGHPDLKMAYAASGRKQEPACTLFALLEAEARLALDRVPFPRALVDALELGTDQALDDGDENTARQLQETIFAEKLARVDSPEDAVLGTLMSLLEENPELQRELEMGVLPLEKAAGFDGPLPSTPRKPRRRKAGTAEQPERELDVPEFMQTLFDLLDEDEM